MRNKVVVGKETGGGGAPGSVTDRIPSCCKDKSRAAEGEGGGDRSGRAPFGASNDPIDRRRRRLWWRTVDGRLPTAASNKILYAHLTADGPVSLEEDERDALRPPRALSNGHPPTAGQPPSPKTFDQNRADSPPAGGKHAGRS